MLDELLVGHAPGVVHLRRFARDDDMDETCGHESGGSTRGASECSGWRAGSAVAQAIDAFPNVVWAAALTVCEQPGEAAPT
jgi:hypothetical protein